MQSDNYYTFDKGSLEYDIIKTQVSRKARRKLGIKFPIFGKYRNKVIINPDVYIVVINFLMTCKANPDIFMSDVIITETK